MLRRMEGDQFLRRSDPAFGRRHRLPSLTGIAALIVLAASPLTACGSSAQSSTPTSATPTAAPARARPAAVNVSQLHALAARAGHPVYWAGAFTGTYELTRIADGRTYIRYLPSGVAVGTARTFLTIGTYVRPSPPFATVRKAALAKRATIESLPGGGLAVQYPSRMQSVFMVFPGASYEVEVYDPSTATALHLVTTGKVVPLP